MIEMIRRRTSDMKVGVRKAGLQALEAIVVMDSANTRIKVSVNSSNNNNDSNNNRI